MSFVPGDSSPSLSQAASWLAALACVISLNLVPHPAAHAQSAESVGVRYPASLKVEGETLALNGSGVAYRALAKLYAMALYVPSKSNEPTTVQGQKGPMQLQFTMLQGMRVDELGKVITRGIELNSSREEFFKLIPAISLMGEQFAHIRRLNPKDQVAIQFVPQRGTMFFVNGQPAGLPIADPDFFPAILRVWLGQKPNSQTLKEALLDIQALGVPDALD